MLGDIAGYSDTRISSSLLTPDTYVGVDNLLQDRMGKTVSMYLPTTGTQVEYQCGDILIGNIRPYLKKVWFSNNIGGASGDVLVIRLRDCRMLPRYLYYVLSSDKFFEYAMRHSKGAKMPRGSKDDILKYEFVLPSIDYQKYVIKILDMYDTLVYDISVGIPAEIEARQSQYEYYRDKLLSFPVKL